jgi:hypothetical protein
MSTFEVCLNSYPIKETITYAEALRYLQAWSKANDCRMTYIGSDILQENWVLYKEGILVHRASIANY